MSSKENRNTRIIELKIKSKRNIICKKFTDIISTLDVDSFISIEDTMTISKRVYKKFDTLKNQEEITKDIDLNMKKVAILEVKFRSLFDKCGILLHYEDRESGAIKIKVEDFFKYLDYIVEFSRFKDGYRDLIFVDEDLMYGICVEKYEYFNKLIVWNYKK